MPTAPQTGRARRRFAIPRLLVLVLLVLVLLVLAHCSAEPPSLAPGPSDPIDVAVRVRSVLLDPSTDSPIVLLEETDGGRTLPIWIGEAEAQSIAVELSNIEWPRPNSHDLAKRMLVGLGAKVERVIVTELRDGTYFAVLIIHAAGKRVAIDSRPSDAIAIALRAEAQVYVREPLFESAAKESRPNDGRETRVSL